MKLPKKQTGKAGEGGGQPGTDTKLGPRPPASPDASTHPRRYLFLSEQKCLAGFGHLPACHVWHTNHLGFATSILCSSTCHKTNPHVPQKRTVTCMSSSDKNQKSPPNWPLWGPEGKEIDRPKQDACFDGRAGFCSPLPVTLPRGMWIDDCMTRGHSQAPGGQSSREKRKHTLRAHFPSADSIVCYHFQTRVL